MTIITTTTNPDSTLGVYLTTVKVAQCRQVDENREKKEEVKKVTVKNTATRKFHIQLNGSEAFDR